MNSPLVSIILTYYNHASYVAQTIESVLNQTYFNLELIIINDGSPDTPEFEQIVANYQSDARLKVITQPNQGIAVARNAGLAVSKGEYLNFLDSDDCFHPEKLAQQVTILEANPELGMVYCDIQQINAEGKELETSPMPERASGPMQPNLFEALWIVNFIEPSTPLFRRYWYDKAGPVTVGIEGHSDYEFWLRLSALGCKVQYLPHRLLYYRIHAHNVSKNLELMNSSRLKARHRILDKFPELVIAQDDKVQLRFHAFKQKLLDYERVTQTQANHIQNLEDNKFIQQALETTQQALETTQQTLETAQQALSALQHLNQTLKQQIEVYKTREAELIEEQNTLSSRLTVLSDILEQEKLGKDALAKEVNRLKSLLARFEKDLRDLQNTRSVRFFRMAGLGLTRFQVFVVTLIRKTFF